LPVALGHSTLAYIDDRVEEEKQYEQIRQLQFLKIATNHLPIL